MALNRTLGGGNQVVVWEIDTTTPTALSAGTQEIVLNKNVSSSISGRPSLNFMTLDLENKGSNSDFDTWLDAALVDVAITSIEDVYEDDTREKGVTIPSTAKKRIVAHLGPQEGGKRRLTFFTGILSGDTGNIEYSQGSSASAPVQFTAIEASATTTISGADIYAAYSNVISATPSDVTVTGYGKVQWITA